MLDLVDLLLRDASELHMQLHRIAEDEHQITLVLVAHSSELAVPTATA